CKLWSAFSSLSPEAVTVVEARDSDFRDLSSFNSFNPASVTFVFWRSSDCKPFQVFSCLRVASVALKPPLKSTPITGLPGREVSTVTLPPTFSIVFNAASSSTGAASTKTIHPRSTPDPAAPRCCSIRFSSDRLLISISPTPREGPNTYSQSLALQKQPRY